jgi:pilus assembly protein CpaF
MEGETVTLQDLFVFEKRGISREGNVQGRFAATGIRPRFSERMMAAGINLSGDLFESVVEVNQ